MNKFEAIHSPEIPVEPGLASEQEALEQDEKELEALRHTFKAKMGKLVSIGYGLATIFSLLVSSGALDQAKAEELKKEMETGKDTTVLVDSSGGESEPPKLGPAPVQEVGDIGTVLVNDSEVHQKLVLDKKNQDNKMPIKVILGIDERLEGQESITTQKTGLLFETYKNLEQTPLEGAEEDASIDLLLKTRYYDQGSDCYILSDYMIDIYNQNQIIISPIYYFQNSNLTLPSEIDWSQYIEDNHLSIPRKIFEDQLRDFFELYFRGNKWSEDPFLKNYLDAHHLSPILDDIKQKLMKPSEVDIIKGNPYYSQLENKDILDATYHALKAFDEALKGAGDAGVESNFMDYLESAANNCSEQQKALILQTIGKIFYENYDEDAANIGKDGFQGEISLAELIKAGTQYYARGEKIPMGVCRHINTRLATIGHHALGMDTFASDVNMAGPHVIAGFRSQENSDIVFLNYNEIIPSNTPDMEKAFGIFERSVGYITPGKANITDAEGKIITTIQSRAGQDIYETGSFVDPHKAVGEALNQGEIIHENGLNLEVNNVHQKIKLTNDHLILAFTRFDRRSDPYNSLSELYAIGAGKEIGGQHHRLGGGITVLSKSIKDLGSGTINDFDLLAHLGYSYANSRNLSPNFNLGLAAAIEGVAVYNFHQDQAGARSNVSGALGGISNIDLSSSSGLRLAYINPQNPYSFFVQGTADVNINRGKNIQEVVKPTPHLSSMDLKVGAQIDVSKEVKVGVTGDYRKLDYGKSMGVEAMVNKGNLHFGLDFQKIKSDYQTILPDSREGRIILTRDNIDLAGVKGALTIFGTIKEQDFKVAKSKDMLFRAEATIFIK